MSSKSEVFEILDDRLNGLKRKIEWFEKFGNKTSQQELIKHAINLSQREELQSLKGDLTYSVAWKQEGE